MLYVRWVGKAHATTSVDRHGRLLEPQDVIRTIDPASRGGRPLVVVYWISDTLALATLLFAGRIAQELLAMVTVLIDATIPGRLTGHFLDRVGGRCRILQPPGHRRDCDSCSR